jgi:hypothetical protein
MSGAEWIKLVSCGRYGHQKGLQVVDRGAMAAMVDCFNSLRGKLMRKFLGLPIYIGHPDDPECDGSQNSSIYGRIENLKIEDDALWILTQWTDLGRKLFGGKFFRHLSPRWMMREIENGLFHPVRLISVGMTNHPNMCCGGDLPVDVPVQCIEKNEEDSQLNAAVESDVGDCELHTNSVTENLSVRVDEQPIKDRILTLVYGRMADFCEDYQVAWSAVKRQHPRLFTKNF